MGNYAYFRSCRSRDAAARPPADVEADAGNAAAADARATPTQVEAKYRIPLFWLAGFSPDDLVTVQARDVVPPLDAPGRDPTSEVTATWSVPCTPAHQFVTCARARRAAMFGQCQRVPALTEPLLRQQRLMLHPSVN